MNGAEAVGAFQQQYRDGFDLVDAIRDLGVHAFTSSNVTSHTDLWASRSTPSSRWAAYSRHHHLQLRPTESGYRFGRSLPEIDGENMAERRARVRSAFRKPHRISARHEHKNDGFCHGPICGPARRSTTTVPCNSSTFHRLKPSTPEFRCLAMSLRTGLFFAFLKCFASISANRQRW